MFITQFLITSMLSVSTKSETKKSHKKIWLFMQNKKKQVIFLLAISWRLLYIVLNIICQIDCTHIKLNNFLLKTQYTTASWLILYLWCRLLDAYMNLSANGYLSYKTVMNSIHINRPSNYVWDILMHKQALYYPSHRHTVQKKFPCNFK